MATSRETTAAEAPVLVLWTGYRAGPWAVRSLRRAGHRVVAAHDAGRGSGGRSAAAPRPLRYPPPDADPEGFAAAVAAICRREGVRAVLPVSEAVTRGLALGTREEDLGGARIVGPDARQYAALCDKARLPASCASAGVDHPEQTVVGADGARAGDWPPLPSVVKPAGSSEHLPGVPAAARVETEGERRRVLDVFARAGVEAVVQEFVEGRPWLVHCVRRRDGFAAVALPVSTTWPRGVGTSSVSRPAPAPEPLDAVARGVLDLVGYVGPACMNVIERRGRFLLHDVNLRLAASVAASIHAGLDIPAEGVAAVLGLPAGPAPPDRPDVLYVRTDGEVAATLAAVRAGRFGPAGRMARELARCWVSPRAVLDPAPLDPFWLWSLAEAPAVRALRRARDRIRPGAGA